MVEDTMPENVKQCSKCGEMKNPDRIVRNRNICKDCCNKKKKENYDNIVVSATEEIICTVCNTTKNATLFIRNTKKCKDCTNNKRRNDYQEIEELRIRNRLEGINY